jgi:hypothetical protein
MSRVVGPVGTLRRTGLVSYDNNNIILQSNRCGTVISFSEINFASACRGLHRLAKFYLGKKAWRILSYESSRSHTVRLFPHKQGSNVSSLFISFLNLFNPLLVRYVVVISNGPRHSIFRHPQQKSRWFWCLVFLTHYLILRMSKSYDFHIVIKDLDI